MEEIKKSPSIYAIPGIPYKVVSATGNKTLTQAIAEAWDIPEEKVLGSTEVIDKKHPSPESARGERMKVPGERKVEYTNARKFYFYVMIEIKKYTWKQLTKITGRKIAAMKYCNQKAQQHMNLEKEYMMKAQYVLDYINRGQVIFPKIVITFEANATVIERGGFNENTPSVPLSGSDNKNSDEHSNTPES